MPMVLTKYMPPNTSRSLQPINLFHSIGIAASTATNGSTTAATFTVRCKRVTRRTSCTIARPWRHSPWQAGSPRSRVRRRVSAPQPRPLSLARAARRRARLDALAEQLEGEASIHEVDLTDERQARSFVEEAHSEHGALH